MQPVAVGAVTFALVAVAELPDKTMIATIVMASRNRPLPVWLGAASAFVLHVALAVAAGRLIQLLPHRVVEAVVASLFAAGALYLLLFDERSAEEKGAQDAWRTHSAHRVALSAFAVIGVSEFGDLTQILIANLAAHYHEPLAVFLGAIAALLAVAAVGVMAGRLLLRVLPFAVIRKVAGVLLGGFAVFSVVQAVRA